MATNYRHEGDVITVAAPTGGIKSGAGALYGSLFGIAMFDAAQAAPVEVGTEGVWVLPKPNSVITFAVGANVYWDAGAGNCTSTAHLNYLIGVATVAAGATDATVTVRLNGVSTAAGA